MFERMRTAFRDWRDWRSVSKAAWMPYLEIGPDGLSRLQVETERRLARLLMIRGLQLVDRQFEEDCLSDPESNFPVFSVVAQIPEIDAEIWLYTDETQIAAPGLDLRLERWGVKTPEEHMALAEKILEEYLAKSDAA